MPISAIPTPLPGVLIIEPEAVGDERGFFLESFNLRDFRTATGVMSDFVQDNHSLSRRGVLRGLHYQIKHPQGKLVRVVAGSVYDVAVDMRRDSDTFGKWFGVELSAQNRRQLWVPPGLAHGFLVMSDVAEFLYKTTEYWHAEYERTLRWDDPDLGIQWPLRGPPVLTARDREGVPFKLSESFGGATSTRLDHGGRVARPPSST